MPNDDETTPPGGNRRVKPMTEHAMIDLGELGMRTADKVQELGAEWRAAKPFIEDIPKMKTMLELALRPQQIPATWNRAVLLAAASAGVIAGCALVFTIAFLAKIVIIPPAFASVPPKIEQRR